MLGTFLVKARQQLQMSQRTLARKAGITPSYLCMIERHNQVPSLSTLAALARALGVRPSSLMDMLYPVGSEEITEVVVPTNGHNIPTAERVRSTFWPLIYDPDEGTIMAMNMWERCKLVKLSNAEFEALLDAGWPYAEPGAARVPLEPTTAKRLLEMMKRNRPAKPRSQQKIVGALLGRYFQENGEPIILNEKLEPIDGQNRLNACAEAHIAMPVLITWGWSDECFDTIDTGTKRSGGDMFSADGELNATLLSSAVRYDWRIVRKNMLSGDQIAEPLMREYLKEHDGLYAACSWAGKVSHLMPKGMAVALFYRFSQNDAGMAKQFFDQLSKGENINAKDHVTWHLRELLLARHLARLQLNLHIQAQIAANVIKAWNAYRDKKVLTRGRLIWQGEGDNPEPFPEIL